MKLIAFNDPFWTDEAPYCNSVRVMREKDAIDMWRRSHPDFYGTDERALDEFKSSNWAWDVEADSLVSSLIVGI